MQPSATDPERPRRHGKLYWSSVTALTALLAVQLVPSSGRNTPAPDGPSKGLARTVANPAVEAILHRSCEDCHSSRANLPWYGHVAPVSWIVQNHVTRGIKKWDMAVWEDRPPLRGEKADMCDSVTDGSMPIPSYTRVHWSARLSPHDIELLCDWADAPALASKR